MRFSRFGVSRLTYKLAHVRNVLVRVREALFDRHLLATNVTISVALSALGDAIQQQYQMVKSNSHVYHVQRSCDMAATGAAVGFICHFWYIWLDKKLVFVDQLVFSPFLIAFFLISLQLIRGRSNTEIQSALRSKFLHLYAAEWAVWPPAQAFSFYALSTRYRVLWDNLVSLGYDTYTSYVVHDDVADSTGVVHNSATGGSTVECMAIFDNGSEVARR